MIAKTFEIRDRMTFIPVLAVKLEPCNEADRYLLARAGFGIDPVTQSGYVILTKINDNEGLSTSDPYSWPGGLRTMQEAHKYIRFNFASLESGAVVDVEFLLGEKPAPAMSEHAQQIMTQ